MEAEAEAEATKKVDIEKTGILSRLEQNWFKIILILSVIVAIVLAIVAIVACYSKNITKLIKEEKPLVNENDKKILNDNLNTTTQSNTTVKPNKNFNIIKLEVVNNTTIFDHLCTFNLEII